MSRYNFFANWEFGLAVLVAIGTFIGEGVLRLLAEQVGADGHEALPSWDEWQAYAVSALAGVIRIVISLTLAAITGGAIQGAKD